MRVLCSVFMAVVLVVVAFAVGAMVVPAGAAQRVQHLGPHGLMVLRVLLQFLLFDFEQESDAFHGSPDTVLRAASSV